MREDETEEFDNEYAFIKEEEKIKMEMLKQIKEEYERNIRKNRAKATVIVTAFDQMKADKPRLNIAKFIEETKIK